MAISDSFSLMYHEFFDAIVKEDFRMASMVIRRMQRQSTEEQAMLKRCEETLAGAIRKNGCQR